MTDYKELVSRLHGHTEEVLNVWELRHQAAEAIERLSADNERLERIRQKLIKDRFALSAEADAHLEAFGIDGADDSYTVFELLINKCAKLMDEIAALKSELKEISRALDDPRCDISMTMVEIIKELKSENKRLSAEIETERCLSFRNQVAKLEEELAALKSASAEPVATLSCDGQGYWYPDPNGTPLYLHPAPAAVQEDAKDAARYRWLRERLFLDGAEEETLIDISPVWQFGAFSNVDTFIDQAMKESDNA